MGLMLLAEATVQTEQQRLSLVSIDTGTIVFTLINTLLIVLAYRFFLHIPVMAMLSKRQLAVSAEMDAAREAKEKAESAEKEYLERLARSKEEAQEIVAKATARAQAREEEIIAEASRSAALIREKADESIERERKRAINEIKNQISELVILTAQAVAEKEINEADNKALIDSFLVRIGDDF